MLRSCFDLTFGGFQETTRKLLVDLESQISDSSNCSAMLGFLDGLKVFPGPEGLRLPAT